MNNHELMLEINGYASAEGTNQFNQTLSSLRALEVENYLVKRGVAPDRLIPQGFGTANPIASNSTQEGREKNRRVEFSVR
ncbi:MAG: OmpA family protein [Pseudomonadota bacterium]